MKVSGKGVTRSGETYYALRAGILNGEISPGDKVRIQDLCQRYGVSLGAVRESLSQLMAEGLVFSEAHRGFTISPLSVTDLQDLTRVRTEVETLCLTWSIQAGKLDWESNLIAATHRLTKAYSADDDSRIAAHDEYHAVLLSACGSPRLLQFRKQLYDSSERYRRLEAVLVSGRCSDDEHREITEAAIERDILLATRLLKSHIERTTENIVAAMQKKGERPSHNRVRTKVERSR